ncbi:PREDICTED: RNA-directed DNA polymerase from mobile element jockey-like [Acromyrmex echinatior]|uniref:RNA-directed DNA polymerase from mobile element jockey-like n=1 Tax=Acromyrmex echinatior TaxID=103372 RepID=UPI000580E759|nr:PREDICTED: RNA-directed DNA polymerase from mobile element jockey-like [Acromyrmex echinatior]
MLISETHFTKKNYIKFANYTTYHTLHPAGTAHGGSAIIIKNTIKHHLSNNYQTEKMQATNVVIEDWISPITISVIYYPPKHATKQEDFESYFETLGHRFISGGDFNAKHPLWGSRLMSPKGRELCKAMENLNLESASKVEPTYWPTDRRKIPDVIDFYVIKNINKRYLKVQSCLELSSDHSPVLLSVCSKVFKKEKPCVLCNRRTDWTYFREQVEKTLNTSISLKTENEINESVEHFNLSIQQAAWNATSFSYTKGKDNEWSDLTKQKITEKRRLRKQWQMTRSPEIKTKLNRATKHLQKLLNYEKNQRTQEYLQNLGATQATDYSLWKATKRLKQPVPCVSSVRRLDGTWAKSATEKANTFAEHLKETFTPYDAEQTGEEPNLYGIK